MRLFFFFFLFPACLFCDLNNIKDRIRDHFVVKDFIKAQGEIKNALDLYPNSKELNQFWLKSLALQGREKEMLNVYRDYLALYPKDVDNKDMLEMISWSIVKQEGRSPIIRHRLSALLGALGTHDIYAVSIFAQNMKGQNSFLRSIAVQLTPFFRDRFLQLQVLDLLENDPVWYVRLSAIVAAGRMRMKSATDKLKNILKGQDRMYEEKMAAISSLINIYEKIDDKEFESLVNSSHMEFRILACKMLVNFNLKNHLDKIIPLLEDSNAEVRQAALRALSILGIKSYGKISTLLDNLIEDFNTEVAITASHLALVNDYAKGRDALEKYLFNEKPKIRRFAAAAVAASGKHGISLATKVLKISKDPYVCANLAVGLIGQRESIDISCDAILNLLNKHSDRIMWDDSGSFRMLAPSDLKHRYDVVNFPELIDQQTRLTLLNLLAIVRNSKAKEGIKQFLKKKQWSITGIASVIILEECDDTSIQLVYELLTTKDLDVKVQAALVLANLSRDERAIKVLQESYYQVDRELKIKILESFGNFRSNLTSEFLNKVLMSEQSTILRVTAAASLVQSLNN